MTVEGGSCQVYPVSCSSLLQRGYDTTIISLHNCYSIATFRQACAFRFEPTQRKKFLGKNKWCGSASPLFTKVMVIRLKRIYIFWCSMLVYISLPHVFIMFYIILAWFMKLTYWQDAQCQFLFSAVFFISEKLFCEVFRNAPKIYVIYFPSWNKDGTRRIPGGGSPGPQTPSRGGPTLGRAWGPPGALLRRLESPLCL